ncbi:GH24538 [Drosophila grimshawi]|uniref:GH24538 n=1 Tax=Drosophila grimshawi TaxID=7222 RepID=B4JLW8_DROGR|nr:GH24538 [Drosophila grimshawi]
MGGKRLSSAEGSGATRVVYTRILADVLSSHDSVPISPFISFAEDVRMTETVLMVKSLYLWRRHQYKKCDSACHRTCC